jgi:plastocyanin
MAGAWLLARAGLFMCLGLLLAGSCSPRQGERDRSTGSGSPVHVSRHHVVLHAISFDPSSLMVAVGDTVEWDNRDLVPHTSTAVSHAWNSGNIAPDSSWSTVIEQAGALPYGCSYHPAMKAKIIAR